MKSSQQNPGSSAESRAAGRAPGNGSRRQAEQAEALAASGPAIETEASSPSEASRPAGATAPATSPSEASRAAGATATSPSLRSDSGSYVSAVDTTARAQRRAATPQASRATGAMIRDPMAAMFQLSRDYTQMWESFLGRSFANFGRGFGWNPFFADSLLPMMRSLEQEAQAPLSWAPRIDVEDRDDSLLVRADLPGVRCEDVQVEVDGDVLMVSGERRSEREQGGNGQGYRFLERSTGRFWRSIPLPTEVEAENVHATLRDGVLEIEVTLPSVVRRRRIEIAV